MIDLDDDLDFDARVFLYASAYEGTAADEAPARDALTLARYIARGDPGTHDKPSGVPCGRPDGHRGECESLDKTLWRRIDAIGRTQRWLAIPGNRERAAERTKEWNAANPERLLANTARWQRNNPDLMARYYRRYRETHPETVAANERRQGAKRRARKLAAPTDIPSGLDVNRYLWERQGGLCGICDRPVAMKGTPGEGYTYDPEYPHVDHVVPLGLGGPHTLDNLQLTHARCNLAKNARTEYPRKEVIAS